MSERMECETVSELRVGQLWADNDPRAAGRMLKVVELLPNGAICEVVAESATGAALRQREGLRGTIGKRTAIRADRFRPTKTGYRLVSEGDTA